MGTCPGMAQASDVALPSRAEPQPRCLQVVEPGLLAAPWPAAPPAQFPPWLQESPLPVTPHSWGARG